MLGICRDDLLIIGGIFNVCFVSTTVCFVFACYSRCEYVASVELCDVILGEQCATWVTWLRCCHESTAR